MTRRQGHSQRHQVRIIGGRWRSRRLPVNDAPGLRPTGDRVRETVFNWLQLHLPGARVLDLFAGTGALGLEALSRGAATAVLVERDHKLCERLRESCTTLGATDARVVESDALRWLRQPATHRFDIVFIDPPFDLGLWQAAMDGLCRDGWLAAGALVYLEYPRDDVPTLPARWRWHRQGMAGATGYGLAVAATDSG